MSAAPTVRGGGATGERTLGAGARQVTIVAHDVGSVGGMERALAELALGLRERGFRVSVIARTCELPPDTGVVFHRVPGPSRPFVIAYPWFLLAGSLAVIRWGRGTVQATGAIVLNRVDTIAVHCCHQVFRPEPSRQGRIYRWYGALLGLMARGGERLCFGVNRGASYVCVSEGLAGEVREHFPRTSGAIVAIHNGVDTEDFAPGAHREQADELRERLGIAPERLVLLFVGNANKGLRWVLQALEMAPEWDLVVAGRGHVRNFQELATSLGVSSSVHWLGVVREIEKVYEMADAFVLPSDYETFSLVTFEAAASGLAILATPVSGVRELIEDGESGFLITQDPTVIAERLGRLAASPTLRARFGRAAREAALGFTWKRMLDEHEQLYAGLSQTPTG